ncbi:hypothetical protein JCM10450v2_001092 [Rhodotorula kratochvilovae]
MALEENPLLGHTHSPSSSISSTSPPLPPRSRRTPLSTALAQLFATKRRWLVALALYALLAVAWYAGMLGLPRSGEMGGLRWPLLRSRPIERIVYNAYGEAFPFSPDLSAVGNAADLPVIEEGSTSLGPSADAVFRLFPSGPHPSPALYLSTLEAFLRTHFPAADSDATSPTSLITALRSYFPTTPSSPIPARPIPHTVWQTAPDAKYFALRQAGARSWTEKNKGWEVRRQDNAEADAWVRQRFALPPEAEEEARKGAAEAVAAGEEAPGEAERSGVVAAWDRLMEPAVLRSDFWRYLVLAVEGGVYADTDVECLKPVERWGEDASWKGERPTSYEPPSLVVGIEADIGNRQDWHDWWPRPLQISQWTMASARGHPVLLDTMRRIVEMSLLPEEEQPKSVMERTGPGPFTDAVLSYLEVMYRKPWSELRGLGSNGWRFRASADAPEILESSREEEEHWGDVKMLSITGFSPGVGHMGAHEKAHAAAMASHAFAGSWRKQKGADA